MLYITKYNRYTVYLNHKKTVHLFRHTNLSIKPLDRLAVSITKKRLVS